MSENITLGLIQKMLKQIEQKMNWGDYESWVNHHFEVLSENIYTNTKVAVSVTTLKRLFGKLKTPNSFYNPQVETRNALSVFLGFKNWEDFVSHHYVKSDSQERDLSKEKRDGKDSLQTIFFKRLKSISTQRNVWVVFFVLLLFVGVFYILNSKKEEDLEVIKSKSSFKIAMIHDTVPNSLRIVYHIDSSLADSFSFSYNDGIKTPLLKANGFFAEYIDMPDFYIFQIWYKDKLLKNISLHLVSKNWMKAVSGLYNNSWKKTMFLNSDFNQIRETDAKLFLSSQEIKSTLVDTTKPYYIEFRRSKKFDISLDTMTFSMRIQNPFYKNDRHKNNEILLSLVGEKNRIILMLNHPIQSANGGQTIGDKRLSAKSMDLSGFTYDFTKPTHVKVQVRDNYFYLYFDGKQTYKTSVPTELGKLKSIIITMYKSKGSVFDYSLYNAKGLKVDSLP